MAAASPALLRRLERASMGAIAPARGLAALAGLLQGLAPRRPRRATPAQAVGNPFVWARFGRPGQSAPFLLAALLDAPAAAGAPAHPPRDGAEAWGPLEAPSPCSPESDHICGRQSRAPGGCSTLC